MDIKLAQAQTVVSGLCIKASYQSSVSGHDFICIGALYQGKTSVVPIKPIK
jgi:hypothetical protein